VTFLAGHIYLGINIISGEEVASLLRPLHSFLYLFSSTPNHGPSLLQSFSPVWPPPDRDSIYSRLPRAISAKGTTNTAARLVPVKKPRKRISQGEASETITYHSLGSWTCFYSLSLVEVRLPVHFRSALLTLLGHSQFSSRLLDLYSFET
jgi:hypothetical protein